MTAGLRKRLRGLLARPMGALVLLALLTLIPASPALSNRSANTSRRRAHIDGCHRPDPGLLAYQWPLKPFDEPHPVRGNFGDPRTVFWRSLNDGGLDGPGAFSFHDGVDISAHVWTPVYPVVSGRAHVRNGETVVVRTSDDRRFEYTHIRLAIRDGVEVSAGKTVLGFIKKPWRHVHLAEIDPIPVRGVPDSGYMVANPLAHLVPFGERTPPVVRKLEARDKRGRRLALSELHGEVTLVVDSFHFPAVPVPGAWHDMPVSPALIQWELTTSAGTPVAPKRTAVDFRRTIPQERRFWQVYARGSYQNFPVIGRHYYFGRPGHLLYVLDRHLDTRRLPNGPYLATVRAADICGNSRTLTVHLRIDNHLG